VAGLLYRCNYAKYLTKDDISKIDILIQKELYPNELKRKDNYNPVEFYLYELGLTSYERLNDNEKMELSTMIHTYENCKNYVLNIFNRYIENEKKEFPLQIWKCFNEKCFIAYIQSEQSWKAINKINILIELIKDYFILDKRNERFAKYRDNTLFNEIKNEMINIYPALKDTYGINRYIEKFCSYLDLHNDYNNEFLKNLLDNYYNNKKNEGNKENKYIPIKTKED